MNLHTREKLLSVMLVFKDICRLLIKIFCATVLFCVCVENGWLSPLIPLYDITNKEFWAVYWCLLCVVPFIIFYNILFGKYTVIIEKTSVEKEYESAKYQRFSKIRRIK